MAHGILSFLIWYYFHMATNTKVLSCEKWIKIAVKDQNILLNTAKKKRSNMDYKCFNLFKKKSHYSHSRNKKECRYIKCTSLLWNKTAASLLPYSDWEWIDPRTNLLFNSNFLIEGIENWLLEPPIIIIFQ